MRPEAPHRTDADRKVLIRALFDTFNGRDWPGFNQAFAGLTSPTFSLGLPRRDASISSTEYLARVMSEAELDPSLRYEVQEIRTAHDMDLVLLTRVGLSGRHSAAVDVCLVARVEGFRWSQATEYQRSARRI